jgi:uncharacterized LabA/DUF88 family protein
MPKAHVWWDAMLLLTAYEGHLPEFDRAVYFTSLSGTEAELHQARVFLRESGFEPEIVLEPADLKKGRENLEAQTGVRKSAKGVDIGLAARMLEDAHRNNFNKCVLASSDIDFLPVIKTFRAMGKDVVVMAYRDGIGRDSAFEYAPDDFIDLRELMKKHYTVDKTKVHEPATRRSGRFLVIDPPNKNIAIDFVKDDLKALERSRAIANKLLTDLTDLASDSIQVEGINVDPQKVEAVKIIARELEQATGLFLKMDKSLNR